LQGPPPKRTRRSQAASKGTMAVAGDVSGPAVAPFSDAVPDSTEPSTRDATHRSQATSQSGERIEGGAVTTLPLPVDTVIRTKWKDGEYHLARVVHTRVPKHSRGEKDTEYYMHFINMNRRMDTWCTISMMDLSWHVYDGIDEKRCFCYLGAIG
jgi:hypothetical protein